MTHLDDALNIEKIGPGFWATMHMLAANAQIPENVKLFKDYMSFISNNFPCDMCKPHFQEYLRTHPYPDRKERYDDKDISYFRYTWEMHNKVNDRLRKYTNVPGRYKHVSFEDAYNIYFKKEECEKSCPGMVEEDENKNHQRGTYRNNLSINQKRLKNSRNIKRNISFQ